jgi:Skp family chaperone for outer membrane proteins
MRRACQTPSAILLLLASAFPLSALSSGEEPPPQGAAAQLDKVRAAKVDVNALFPRWSKIAAVQEELRILFDAQRRDLENEQAELSELRKYLSRLEGDREKADEFAQGSQVLRLREEALKRTLTIFVAQVETKRTDRMQEVLADLVSAVRAVAGKEGFDVVVRAKDAQEAYPLERPASTPKTPPLTAAEVVKRFKADPVVVELDRTVVAAHLKTRDLAAIEAQAVDITDRVLQLLNAPPAR